MTFEELHQSVLTWANERGLLAYGSPCAQYLKTSEELGELAAAMARHEREACLGARRRPVGGGAAAVVRAGWLLAGCHGAARGLPGL